MKLLNKKAFTMIELIFVIVIIGTLSSIFIPHFAEERDNKINKTTNQKHQPVEISTWE